jgi:hypothetical protein
MTQVSSTNRKNRISWGWLACFTDSEGSIHYSNSGRLLQISWSQSVKNEILLDVVADFLADRLIAFSDSYGVNNSGVEFRRLVVGKQDSAQVVLERMLPYLILKREKAQEALKFLGLKRKEAKRRKARCKYGHERTPENIYVHPKTGKRSCVQCRREASMRSYYNHV